MFYKYPFLFRE